MIINPIYLSLNSNSNVNGENDWDPTDVKENKEMLDLTGYTLMSNVTEFCYNKNDAYSFDSKIKASSNTILIMTYCHRNTSSDETNYPVITPHIVGGTEIVGYSNLNVSSGTKINLPAVIYRCNSITIKIKLPSIYDNLIVGFGVSFNLSIPLNVWYKNE